MGATSALLRVGSAQEHTSYYRRPMDDSLSVQVM